MVFTKEEVIEKRTELAVSLLDCVNNDGKVELGGDKATDDLAAELLGRLLDIKHKEKEVKIDG